MLAACTIAALLALGQPPLAGPKVDPPRSASTSSLVEHDFDGAVKVPDIPPEEKALALLGLDAPDATPAQREAHAAARKVLEARARFIDDFVVNNIPLLTMFGNAENTGDKRDQIMLALEAMRKFAPMIEGGTLREQLAACLPEADRSRYEAMLDEFWAALVRDRAKRPKADGKKPGRLEVVIGAKLESFGREGERAFARVQYSGTLLYHYATKGMRLTPHQKRTLRELAEEHAAKGDDVTEEDNRRLFTRALMALRVDQRPKFIKNLRGL